MARRKRRSRGHTDWLSKIFNILGIVVAAGPAIIVLQNDLPSGKFQSIPNDVLFAYTGLGGTTQWNQQAATTGIGAIVGGAVVASIPRIFRLIKRMLGGRR
jgi:hypothetical protein